MKYKKIFEIFEDEIQIKNIEFEFLNFVYELFEIEGSKCFQYINISSRKYDESLKHYNKSLIYGLLACINTYTEHFDNLDDAKRFLDKVDISGKYIFKFVKQHNCDDYIDAANTFLSEKIIEKIYNNQQILSQKFYEIVSRNIQ